MNAQPHLNHLKVYLHSVQISRLIFSKSHFYPKSSAFPLSDNDPCPSTFLVMVYDVGLVFFGLQELEDLSVIPMLFLFV